MTIQLTIDGVEYDVTPRSNIPPTPPPSDYALGLSPQSAKPGESVVVAWSVNVATGPKDWIALYAVGAVNEKFLAWAYTGGVSSGSKTLIAPATAGQYEARYLIDDAFVSKAISKEKLTVTASPTPAPTPTGKRPDATNTGPTDRSKLATMTAVLTITKPGTYENFDAQKGISIAVPAGSGKVLVRNFVSRDNIKIYDGGSGVTFEDGEVYSTTGSDGISGQNMTLRRLNIHNVHDGVRIGTDGNVLMEGCWLHELGTSAGHSDGVQVLVDVPNVVIRGTFIDAGGCTSCLNGVGSGWLVTENWLYGGGYTMYCYAEGTPEIINNHFGDQRYGAARFWPDNGIWTGNINDATGKPI